MPQYEATLSDGRTVTLEADSPPTEAEVLSAVASYESSRGKRKAEVAEQTKAAKLEAAQNRLVTGAIDLAERAVGTVSQMRPDIAITKAASTVGLDRPTFTPEQIQTAIFGPHTVAGSASEGAKQFAAEMASGLSSPAMVGTMLAAPAAPAAVGRTFQTAMIGDLPSATQAFVEAQQTGDTAEAVRTGLGVATALALPAAIERGISYPRPKVPTDVTERPVPPPIIPPPVIPEAPPVIKAEIAKPENLSVKEAQEVLTQASAQKEAVEKGAEYARSQQQAAEVYGPVLPQPGEGAREVPAAVSGERVQPQAEGRLPGTTEGPVLLTPEKTRTLREIWDEWNERDTAVVSELADEVEFAISEGKAPESLKPVVEAYREAVREDYEMAGRGEVDPAADALVAAIEREVGAPKEAPATPKPAVSPQPDVDISAIEKATTVAELDAATGKAYKVAEDSPQMRRVIAAAKKRQSELTAEKPAEPAAPVAAMEPVVTRSRPRELIRFSSPIIGPSKAKMVAYEWQWIPEEYIDKMGEERTRRVSNWEESVGSGDTGRDIVHQFHVEMPDGSIQVVSAESVPKLLGLSSGNVGKLPSAISASKTLAKLKVEHAKASAEWERFNADFQKVNAIPTPPIEDRGPFTLTVGREAGKPSNIKIWGMGEATVLQHNLDPITPERIMTLIDTWRSDEMRKLGWSSGTQGYSIGNKLDDLNKRISKQEKKLADIGAKSSQEPAPPAETPAPVAARAAAEVPAPAETKTAETVTDPSRRQEIKNSIAEGELILQSGRTLTGRKMTPAELDAVRRSVESAKAKLETPKPATEKAPKPELSNADAEVFAKDLYEGAFPDEKSARDEFVSKLTDEQKKRYANLIAAVDRRIEKAAGVEALNERMAQPDTGVDLQHPPEEAIPAKPAEPIPAAAKPAAEPTAAVPDIKALEKRLEDLRYARDSQVKGSSRWVNLDKQYQTAYRKWKESASVQEPTAAVPKPTEAKEPWQMTKAEYTANLAEKYPTGKLSDGRILTPELIEEFHRASIGVVLSGPKAHRRIIPPDVLADYPDLAAKAPKVEPSAVPKAEKKVQQEIKEVAIESGQADAKEVKTELLRRIEEAMRGSPEKSAYKEGDHGYVTINIPGDGNFRIPNHLDALSTIRERVQRLSTSPKGATTIPVIRELADADAVVTDALRVYGEPRSAIEHLERQLQGDQVIDPKHRAMYERGIELLRERLPENILDEKISDAERILKDAEESVTRYENEVKKLQTRGKKPTRSQQVDLQQMIAISKRAQESLAADRSRLAALQKEKAELEAQLRREGVAPKEVIEPKPADVGQEPIPQGPGAPTPAVGMPPGPGAASPSEFVQRQIGNRPQPPLPPPPNAPVAVDGSRTPTPEIVRANRDLQLHNRINSGQWNFYFGRLGAAAKAAWERMALGEFKMRESIQRDIKEYVVDTLRSLPRSLRKSGGKAFYELLDGRKMEDVVREWEGKPGGEIVIAQAERLRTRLEEIRTTIRDTKRESFNRSLLGMDKETLQDLFRKNIDDTLDIENYSKAHLADAITLKTIPDDWGIADGSYLPHLFFGHWKVSALMPGAETPMSITRAQTPHEAQAKIYDVIKKNPELKEAQFTIEQDSIIPADMVRLGDRRFWKMIGEMKKRVGSDVNVKEAVTGIIGRKASKQKWFGSLQKRLGVSGYSKDFSQVMTAYLNGFHRWKELTAMNREVQPLIEQVRRENRINAAHRLDDILDNLWGKPARTTLEFDAMLRRVPVVRDYVKPLALDRWARSANSLVANLTLRTARFGVINRLQPLQGLYPLVGERILGRAKILQHTREGRALLDEAGVSFDPGQYSEFGFRGKIERGLERLSGERSNQELGFLAMYLHGTERGLARPEAIKYAKLRGQLMTQFTPLISDTPALFEGPIGRVAFQFRRFPVKQVELISSLVADRNVSGLTRMLATYALMGGVSFFLRQLWLDPDKKLALKRRLDKQHGEKVADAIMYGLPGFFGTDLSGSLVLGDEPYGSSFYEKLGRTISGPAVSLGLETKRILETEPRVRMTAGERAISVMQRIPTLRPLAELERFVTGEIDLTSPDGETKYRRVLRDVILGFGSFRGANEANVKLAVDGIVELEKERGALKNAWYVAVDKGGIEQKIGEFNTRWPEMAISTSELSKYRAYRGRETDKTEAEKVAKKRARSLLPASQD